MQTYIPEYNSIFNYVHPSFVGNSMTSPVAISTNQRNTPEPEENEQNIVISIDLENVEMWKQFRQHETEMIITKPGRRMFPTLRYHVTGLEPNATYAVYLKFAPKHECRYKFSSGKWTVNGQANPNGQIDQEHSMGYVYMHPDSPANGRLWMRQPISFHKIKLTNNNTNAANGLIILNSMQKYTPIVYVLRVHDIDPQSRYSSKIVASASFDETEFVAVTAYQNDNIKQLKINHNPFAKGFREHGKHEEKRRYSPDDGSNDDTSTSSVAKKHKIENSDDDTVSGQYDQVKTVSSSSSISPTGANNMETTAKAAREGSVATPLATVWNPMTGASHLFGGHPAYFPSAPLRYPPIFPAFNPQPINDWLWHLAQRDFALWSLNSTAASHMHQLGSFGYGFV